MADIFKPVQGFGQKTAESPKTVWAKYENMGLSGEEVFSEVITVGTRNVIDQITITAPVSTGVTLASLCTGAVIPENAIVAEIQAIGGSVRIGVKNGATVTPSTGYKLDIYSEKSIDTNLDDVTLVAESSASLCNVTFYDRV